MQVEYNTRSSDTQTFGRGGKTQDGRKNNAQNLSQEDRAKGGRNSAKSRGGQGKGRSNYDDDNDYGDENYDTSNQFRGKSKGQQDGRKNNAQNLSYEDRAKGGRNSAKSRGGQGQQRHYGHDHDNEDYDQDNRGKGQDGRKKNAQNLSQEDRARGGRNSRKSSGDYDNTQYFGTSKMRTSPKNQNQGSKTMPNYARELDELLEDASNFLDQPIPDKVKDNLHYEDGETEDEISGSGVEEMMGGESEPDQAEMDTRKKTYFTEYPKNKNRGQGQGQGRGQDGRRKNAQNLSQEDRARGGRHSGKSKRQQDYGNEDEDEEDYDEDDYQGRGKGQDGRRKNAQNLSHEDRVKGGIESGKSRRGEKQGDYGDEDEDEEDYDEDEYQGRGKQGRGKQGRGFGPGGVSGHVLTQEERARGGRHSAKSRRQGKSDNEDEDEEDYDDEDDNQGRGKQGRGKQGRGFGPGGVSGHVLTQEERARGGRHSAKSRRGQKQGDYDNEDEDEEDYDEDDYQSRGKQGKGYGPGGVTGYVLSQEERARGGRHSAKSRRQRNYGNEDEDEDEDDNQGRGKGQDGRRKNAQNLSHEDRVRGGIESGKSRRGEKQGDYGDEDEDEEDYDEDDYQGRGKQGRGKQGKGYGPGGVTGHVLTQEERARGGRHSAKSRRQGKSDNEDEEEEDYDDDNQGRGKQGRGNQGKGYGPGGVSGHVLTQEERARGGRHSAKGKRQANYDNDNEDEDEPPVQKKRQLQLGKAY